MALLNKKTGIITGILNERSIAWGTAKLAIKEGARLFLTYQNDAALKRLTPLADSLGVTDLIKCDVSDQESIDNFSSYISTNCSGVDFLLHSMAYSDRNELKGGILNTSRENFLNSMNISCFSLISIIKSIQNLINKNGSIVTMTYYGSQKAIKSYNVMGLCKAALESLVRYLASEMGENGVRANGISAGPIKTLASSGIDGFSKILKWNEKNCPLRRNVTLEEIANSCVFLFSDMSSGITGEIVNVDCGYHAMGAPLDKEI